MAQELVDMLRKKYEFLSIMLNAIVHALEELKISGDAEEVYNTMPRFLGEFPRRKMIQSIAEEKDLTINVKTKEDAIRVIKSLL